LLLQRHYIPIKMAYSYTSDAPRRSNKDHLNYYLGNSSAPLIIYAHGNDQSRATSYRIELCNNLVSMGYHVFAFDYRGFGDSTGQPSEIGAVNDLVALYELLHAHRPNSPIYLYGHSLGAG
jgi:abhydrolase domain-containing protein 12